MQIQWLGHSAFKLFGTNANVLIDPFLTGNPKFTGDLDSACEGVTHVLLTHFHNDHFGDTLDILKRTGATLFAMVEIADWVEGKLGGGTIIGANYGGTVETGGFTVDLVPAWHSSSYTLEDGSNVHGGLPAGLIVEIDGHKIYHMGDTAIFSDMELINELYEPEIGIVPMGGHFTMDAGTAALAVNRYFDFEKVIPCHYGTFPLLTQSAETFKSAVTRAEVLTPNPMGIVDI